MKELLKSIMIVSKAVTLHELKQEVLVHNNTLAWIYEDALYIDSSKGKIAFEDISQLNWVDFKVLHEASKEQYEWAMTGEGNFKTPIIGGSKTICNVYRVKLI